jgi:hypothetical protein
MTIGTLAMWRARRTDIQSGIGARFVLVCSCLQSALLGKYAGRCEESLAFNRRGSELAPEAQAAWWNRGIAEAALGQRSEARQ